MQNMVKTGLQKFIDLAPSYEGFNTQIEGAKLLIKKAFVEGVLTGLQATERQGLGVTLVEVLELALDLEKEANAFLADQTTKEKLNA